MSASIETVHIRRVVCAAIRNAKGDIICGPRHWDSIMRDQVTKADADWSRAEQGFVDQLGLWLSREDAHHIALKAGQIIRRCGGDDGCLYSENLY